jgi:hypothetical protein
MNDIVVRLAAALGVDMKETAPMGHLDSFAEDVNETVASLNREFESLNARKTKLKERGAEIAGKWSAHFDGQEAALTVAEAALNRISNVPVSMTKKADPPKDQMLSEVQKNG